MNENGFRALPKKAAHALHLLVAGGGVAVAAGLLVAPRYAWPGLFVASYFALELSLAGLFFVALHYVTGARWHIPLRRIPETMAVLVPLGAAGLAAVILLHPAIYSWTIAGWIGPDPAFAFKRFWLSLPFFRIRSAVYIATWTIFAFAIVRTSRRQDREGDWLLTRRNIRLSAGFLVALAVTLVPASFDWIASLEPRWYSTIFGIYDFSSMFLGGLAAITLLVTVVARLAPEQLILNEEHLHNLGKLLFAFSTFWGYIWFCQYMLIWYANIPEETSYFVVRLHGSWGVMFILNLLMNWAVPFLILLPRRAKTNSRVLTGVAVWLLVGRWLDLSLAILPPTAGERLAAWIWSLGLTGSFAALFAILLFNRLRSAPLMPAGDPELQEAPGLLSYSKHVS